MTTRGRNIRRFLFAAALLIESSACSDANRESAASRRPTTRRPVARPRLPRLGPGCRGTPGDRAASASDPAREPNDAEWSGGDPAHGQALYATHCAICHGGGGAGDGVATPALNPKPRDFRDARFYIDTNGNNRTGEDVDLARVILNGPAAFGGTREMIGWRDALSDRDVRDLIAHIRTLAAASRQRPPGRRRPDAGILVRARAPALDHARRSCRASRGSCRGSARPSASRSRPAPSGGTASCSRARPTGARCSRFARSRCRTPSRRSSTGRSRSCARGSTTGTITQQGDLPPEIWEFLRRERFFGMIIPEAYGGLGFSAQAHAAVVPKLASRSLTAAVTVMVPNSLGPAELLLHYGTDEQSEHYLPRLARGEEIPCFALTGPEAGSDAAATQSEGVVCRDKWRGEEVLGMRLRWSKRYITLAPVATLIGLAFRLRDPGSPARRRARISASPARSIPRDLPRHRDRRAPRPDGHAVPERPDLRRRRLRAARRDHRRARRAPASGWRMLMECLAAGRSISLPSLAVGGREAGGARGRAPTRPCASSSTRRSGASKASRSRSRASPGSPT